MISKNKIKFLCSLKIKKYREKNHSTILEGFRLIDQAVNFNANIQTVWLTTEAQNSNPLFIKNLKSKGINYDSIINEDLKTISDTKNSQGVIAEVDISKYLQPISETIDDNLVIIDGISDPGNLGTIFRTCAWYGINSIILSDTTTDPFNFKCSRSGMGAHFYFNQILSDSTKHISKYLNANQYDVLCADLEGIELSKIKLNQKWAIIFGSEAHGISLDFDTFNKVTIKGSNSIESLNVSVATGIILEHLINNY
jgi:TrmH family RNA methyltransferase